MDVFIFVKYSPYNNLVMTIQDWASLIVAILTIVSSIAFAIKWLVRHYLSELKPNSGSSLKDQVSRLENALDEQRLDSIKSRDRQEKKLDEMYQILIDHIAKVNKE
jgi:cell shape-determining protein MreC